MTGVHIVKGGAPICIIDKPPTGVILERPCDRRRFIQATIFKRGSMMGRGDEGAKLTRLKLGDGWRRLPVCGRAPDNGCRMDTRFRKYSNRCDGREQPGEPGENGGVKD
jgi:hypothetical protein